jgi:hypothetical protein
MSTVPAPLPELLNVAQLAREIGQPRSAAEAIMRHCPKIEIPGYQKSHVRRSDVQRFFEEHRKRA